LLFRSKLSASDISYPAEILDWERLSERNNSHMLAAPPLISGVFRQAARTVKAARNRK
jgi:hypothetical protein